MLSRHPTGEGESPDMTVSCFCFSSSLGGLICLVVVFSVFGLLFVLFGGRVMSRGKRENDRWCFLPIIFPGLESNTCFTAPIYPHKPPPLPICTLSPPFSHMLPTFPYQPSTVPANQQNQKQGSVMLIKANSEEEVHEWVKNDEYVKGGAWDLSKMTIVPFRCAVRTAL